MKTLRRLTAVTSLTVLGLSGVVLATAGPAAATSGATSTLDCTPGTTGSGQSVMSCDVTADAGLRSIRVSDSTFGHAFTTSSSFDCGAGATSGATQFPTFFNDRYKVIVTDCQHPGAKDIYRVGPDGTVTLIKSTGGAA